MIDFQTLDLGFHAVFFHEIDQKEGLEKMFSKPSSFKSFWDGFLGNIFLYPKTYSIMAKNLSKSGMMTILVLLFLAMFSLLSFSTSGE